MNFSSSSSARIRLRRTPRPANSARLSHDSHSTGGNSRQEKAAAPTGFPIKLNSTARFSQCEAIVGAPVWAWMARDRWWPAVILAPTPGLPFNRITIRLEHGVSVTVPISFVVRRDPDLDEKDRPTRALEPHIKSEWEGWAWLERNLANKSTYSIV